MASLSTKLPPEICGVLQLVAALVLGVECGLEGQLVAVLGPIVGLVAGQVFGTLPLDQLDQFPQVNNLGQPLGYCVLELFPAGLEFAAFRLQLGNAGEQQ